MSSFETLLNSASTLDLFYGIVGLGCGIFILFNHKTLAKKSRADEILFGKDQLSLYKSTERNTVGKRWSKLPPVKIYERAFLTAGIVFISVSAFFFIKSIQTLAALD